MQNNTLKKELSELTNEELVEIFKGQQTNFSTLKDEYQKTTLDLHESKLNLSESHNRLNETRLELQKSHSELKKAHDEIAELRYQLNYYLNEKYGTPSDSLPDAQDSTFDEPDNEEEIGSEQENNKQITVKSHTRDVSNKSRGLPEDLPREQLIIDIPEEDKICNCGCNLQRIGEDKSEKLDITPAKVKVIEIIRPKYACRACEEGVHQLPMPKTAIPKGIPTPGTLAHIILSKYEDHLPLYRQESIFQRMGVDIPRNTLCNWVLKSSKLLEPLYELMKNDLLLSKYIQADESVPRKSIVKELQYSVLH